MKLILFIAFALLLTSTLAALQCDATGDPHYRAPLTRGRQFHIYGHQGTYTVAKYVENGLTKLNMQADMWYGKGFSNRALQLDVAVKIGNAVIESNGGTKQKSIYKSIRINGKKKTAPFGWTNADNDNDVRVKATKHNNNHMRLEVDSRKTGGLDIIIDIVYQGNGFVYHNLYIKFPNAWARTMKGFCGIESVPHNKVLPANLVTPWKVPKALSLLHVHYNPANHVAGRVGHIDWKSDALKIAAYKQCGEVNGLSGGMLHDCVYDVKIAGSVVAAKGYEDTKSDMKELMKMGKENGSGYLHAIYVLVVKMRKTVYDEISNSEKVLKGLKDEVAKLEKDIDTTKKMFAAMLGFSSNVNTAGLDALLKGLTADVTAQLNTMKAKVVNEEKVIADAQKELQFIRKVLEFVGEQIQSRKNPIVKGVIGGNSWSSYDAAVSQCQAKGKKLPKLEDVCKNGKLRFTLAQFDAQYPSIKTFTDIWIPVQGKDWIQVRDPNRECWSHNKKYGYPGWGRNSNRQGFSHPAICI